MWFFRLSQPVVLPLSRTWQSSFRGPEMTASEGVGQREPSGEVGGWPEGTQGDEPQRKGGSMGDGCTGGGMAL